MQKRANAVPDVSHLLIAGRGSESDKSTPGRVRPTRFQRQSYQSSHSQRNRWSQRDVSNRNIFDPHDYDSVNEYSLRDYGHGLSERKYKQYHQSVGFWHPQMKKNNLRALEVYVVDFDGRVPPYDTVTAIVGPALLLDAVKSGNASYDSTGAIQYVIQTARQETTTYNYILPQLRSVWGQLESDASYQYLFFADDNGEGPGCCKTQRCALTPTSSHLAPDHMALVRHVGFIPIHVPDMVLGQPWAALWLIFWVITNVATAFYTLELALLFYEWGRAWLLHNVVQATRHIVFDLESNIGLNFGVLFAWTMVNTALFPLCWYFMRWRTEHEQREASGAIDRYVVHTPDGDHQFPKKEGNKPLKMRRGSMRGN
ncbi:hypothetical protein F4782DRAFT_534996 [Xylaria castorea]|nr:hypothetical protein F4782DRAFT_534996 [Xylaria castorea]